MADPNWNGTLQNPDKPSWEYKGRRGIDNFFEHWFVRPGLTPGWSAAQGGLGSSSHTRDADTDTRLRRQCLMNPEGSPYETPDTAGHKAYMDNAMARLDATRRQEFLRRKGTLEIDEKLEQQGMGKRIVRNAGWPFTIGSKVEADDDEEPPPFSAEQVAVSLDDRVDLTEWGMEWRKSILPQPTLSGVDEDEEFMPLLGRNIGWQQGGLVVRSEEDIAKAKEAKARAAEKMRKAEKKTAKKGGMTAVPEGVALSGGAESVVSGTGVEGGGAEEGEFRPLLGGVGLKRGYLEARGGNLVWNGPEKNLGVLDLMVWKPVMGVAPAIIENTGAKQTEQKLRYGLPFDEPPAVQPKKIYGQTYRYKDLLKGGVKQVHLQDGRYFDASVKVRDPMTGVPVYSFGQGERTVTSRVGHGHIDKVELRNRMEKKMRFLKLDIAEVEGDLSRNAAKIGDLEKRVKGGAMSRGDGRGAMVELLAERTKYMDRITGLKLRLQTDQLELEDFDRDEIIAHVAKDMDVSKDILKLFPADIVAGFNQGVKNVGELLGVRGANEGDSEAILEFKRRKELQEASDVQRSEKYFGVFLLNPVTGRLNHPAVKRRNGDMILKAKEKNKAIADVFLARSDGKSHFHRPTPTELKEELVARAEQQDVVNVLQAHAFKQKTDVELEDWARSEERKTMTYGSSAHPAGHPTIATIKAGNGEYMQLRTLAPPPPKLDGDDRHERVSWMSSANKVLFGIGEHRLLGMVADTTDGWHYPATQEAIDKTPGELVTPNALFCGHKADAVDKEKGPYSATLIKERSYNGLPGRGHK